MTGRVVMNTLAGMVARARAMVVSDILLLSYCVYVWVCVCELSSLLLVLVVRLKEKEQLSTFEGKVVVALWYVGLACPYPLP